MIKHVMCAIEVSFDSAHVKQKLIGLERASKETDEIR